MYFRQEEFQCFSVSGRNRGATGVGGSGKHVYLLGVPDLRLISSGTTFDASCRIESIHSVDRLHNQRDAYILGQFGNQGKN